MRSTAQLPLGLDPPGPLSPLPWIRGRLLALHGEQRDFWRPDPMNQLVAAMVSPRTRDEVSLPAFAQLRRRYPTWEALGRATAADIEAIIRPVTFADRKAELIPRALRMIAARSGSFDLGFLADWPEEMAMRWLMELPGVGAKIAATTLNFSALRRRTLPVDTHLLRMGQRLGPLPPGADYDDGYDIYMSLVPDHWDADDIYEFHWLMKLHGQRVCTHATPSCPRCPLQALCQHYTGYEGPGDGTAA